MVILSIYVWCVTSKVIVYNLGSFPTLLSAIATFFSAIVSLYLGSHRTKKPHIRFELLKKEDNGMAILATNYSSQYVRLVAVSEKNLEFISVRPVGLQSKVEMSCINLNPIEEKKEDNFWPPIIFGKDPIAKLVYKDNISNRKYKVYFAHIDNDWKIVPFRKYWINKINYWMRTKED